MIFKSSRKPSKSTKRYPNIYAYTQIHKHPVKHTHVYSHTHTHIHTHKQIAKASLDKDLQELTRSLEIEKKTAKGKKMQDLMDKSVLLQCVAVCCSVLQCVAVCGSVLQCVVVCCSVLQCIAVHCSALQCVAVHCGALRCVAVRCSVLKTAKGNGMQRCHGQISVWVCIHELGS